MFFSTFFSFQSWYFPTHRSSSPPPWPGLCVLPSGWAAAGRWLCRKGGGFEAEHWQRKGGDVSSSGIWIHDWDMCVWYFSLQYIRKITYCLNILFRINKKYIHILACYISADHGSKSVIHWYSRRLKSCTFFKIWSFMILFPLEPPAGTWQMTPLKKKHHLSNPPFCKGFHFAFFPELYNTTQESPKLSAIHGRMLSFKFPRQALTSSAQCGARREEAESGGGGRVGVAGHELLQVFLLVISGVLLFVEVMFVACRLTDQASLTLFLSFRNKDMYLHIIDLYKMLYINNGFGIIIVSTYMYIYTVFSFFIGYFEYIGKYTYICHCIMFGSFPHHPGFLCCAWL